MNCSECKESRTDPVPFIVHESAMARMERTIKRLWILIILIVLLLVGTNAAWIWYESQFAEEVITQEVWQDADNGVNRFIGGDFYGSAEGKNDH